MMKSILAAIMVLLVVSPVLARPMKDKRDGQSYETVKIGSQVWMAKNLNYSTPNSFCYEGKQNNCQRLGRLYKWDDAVNVCPVGWHLPSKEEFETLIDFLIADKAGLKLKSPALWLDDGNGVNSHGFAAVPAGFRYGFDYDEEETEFVDGSDGFEYFGELGFFWSSSVYEGDEYELGADYYAYYMGLAYDRDDAQIFESRKDYARSVRCVFGKSKNAVVATAGASGGMLRDSRDGQTYRTVKISGKEWMAQNLNFKTDDSHCPSYDEDNCSEYGSLYTWSDAMQISSQYQRMSYKAGNKHQGVCPVGWHIPSKQEWEQLWKLAGNSVENLVSKRQVVGKYSCNHLASDCDDLEGSGTYQDYEKPEVVDYNVAGQDKFGFDGLINFTIYSSDAEDDFAEDALAFWNSTDAKRMTRNDDTECLDGYIFFASGYTGWGVDGCEAESYPEVKANYYPVRCVRN